MPITTYKRLNVAAITNAGTSNAQTLYTNSGINGIVGTLVVCNTTDVAQTYRVAVHNTQLFESSTGWIVYNTTVNANDTAFITTGIILDSFAKYLLVSGSSTGLVFSAFGTEVSVG